MSSRGRRVGIGTSMCRRRGASEAGSSSARASRGRRELKIGPACATAARGVCYRSSAAERRHGGTASEPIQGGTAFDVRRLRQWCTVVEAWWQEERTEILHVQDLQALGLCREAQFPQQVYAYREIARASPLRTHASSAEPLQCLSSASLHANIHSKAPQAGELGAERRRVVENVGPRNDYTEVRRLGRRRVAAAGVAAVARLHVGDARRSRAPVEATCRQVESELGEACRWVGRHRVVTSSPAQDVLRQFHAGACKSGASWGGRGGESGMGIESGALKTPDVFRPSRRGRVSRSHAQRGAGRPAHAPRQREWGGSSDGPRVGAGSEVGTTRNTMESGTAAAWGGELDDLLQADLHDVLAHEANANHRGLRRERRRPVTKQWSSTGDTVKSGTAAAGDEWLRDFERARGRAGTEPALDLLLPKATGEIRGGKRAARDYKMQSQIVTDGAAVGYTIKIGLRSDPPTLIRRQLVWDKPMRIRDWTDVPFRGPRLSKDGSVGYK
ncbi:hypothetical protein B0H14DRAFT_3172716 [Mycena olivaceomarginata]|nr:hypothetical protein B0H14DRAFT_3172716 [Mycena olivaceomarginata]